MVLLIQPKEVLRFLKRCDELNMRWRSGHRPTELYDRYKNAEMGVPRSIRIEHNVLAFAHHPTNVNYTYKTWPYRLKLVPW